MKWMGLVYSDIRLGVGLFRFVSVISKWAVALFDKGSGNTRNGLALT